MALAKQLKMNEKNKNENLSECLLGILAASSLRSALTRQGVIRADEGTIRASQNFWCPLIF